MRAIDIHVHVPDPPDHPAAKEKEAMAGYFGAGSYAAHARGDVRRSIRSWTSSA